MAACCCHILQMYMKSDWRFIYLIFSLILLSCSIKENIEPCAPEPKTFTIVDFIYDYNMQKENIFNKQAGSVYLYVFDEDSVMLYRKTKSKIELPNNNVNFSIIFDEQEIVPGNKYNFVAMAQGNHEGYEASLETPGFQLNSNCDMRPGISKISDFIIKLDQNEDGEIDFGIIDFLDEYGNSSRTIDTVWSTKPGEIQTIEIPDFYYEPSLEQLPDNYVNVNIPMLRLTNSITINLLSPAFNSNTNPADYLFLIYFPYGNGTINFTGKTLDSKSLYYRPLRKNLFPYSKNTEDKPYFTLSEERIYAIKAEFGVSRLQYNDECSLQIRNSNNYEIISKFENFSGFLADYFEHGFEDNQEFLDREYDFQVDIALDENQNIQWIQCWCAVLGWAKRTYYYDIK